MNSALVMFGDDLGECGLADAGRSPEDERAEIVALDLDAERLAGGDEVLLADELVEGARTHAVGERASAIGGGVGVRDGFE